MRVISYKKLKEFYVKYKEAEKLLSLWYKLVKNNNYNSFAELRKVFPSADIVGEFTVFNIGGNKYRLIVAVHCNTKIMYIRYVLTHKEYDKGNWKVK